MRHFPSKLSSEESNAFLDRTIAHWEKNGFGLFAIRSLQDNAFLGFTGLNIPPYPLPFSPCVEIGWRLCHNAWGQGYATEAANYCLDWGFEHLGLGEIVSFTARQNTPSFRLMERIGMTRDKTNDFDHPKLDKDSPLLRHVLYRITYAQWSELRAS